MQTLINLSIGKSGTIHSISDSNLQQKLLEMGCTPGEKIQVLRQAPFQGPIAILVSSYILTIRREDAMHIYINSND